MTSIYISLTHPQDLSGSLRQLLGRAWAFSPILTLTTLGHLVLIPLFGAAAIADPRIITGAPAWIKPLKFAVSITIYTATFIWLLTFVQGRRRLVRLVAAVTGIGLSIEMVLIAMQVLRGTTSHFNFATAFDAAVFSIMGATITLVAVLNLVLATWLIRQRTPDRVFAWGLRWGLLVSFAGMLVAFLMTSPTAEQLAAAAADRPLIAGAHSVGVADDGPGLPFLGWSTTGGDLRIPHFVGLHAMQVLPLTAWLFTLDWAKKRWSAESRLRLVWTAGLGYLGVLALLTWQALRGQSIVAPDGLTLAAFAALLSAVVLATGVIVKRAG